MRGTLINTGTVLIGGTLGTLAGTRFPERIRSLLLQAIGLMTLIIGLQRALESSNVLVLLGSVVLGGVVGELLHIERGIERMAERATAILPGQPPGGPASPQPHPATAPPLPEGEGVDRSVAGAWVTSSLIFCVGPMTILGSIEDGLTGAFQTLALKATLDGVTSAVLAASLGWGVILSAAGGEAEWGRLGW